MSDWLQIQPFGRNMLTSWTGSALQDIVTDTNAPGSISPPISIVVDYMLRDEYGAVITDEYARDISLEGFIDA